MSKELEIRLQHAIGLAIHEWSKKPKRQQEPYDEMLIRAASNETLRAVIDECQRIKREDCDYDMEEEIANRVIKFTEEALKR